VFWQFWPVQALLGMEFFTVSATVDYQNEKGIFWHSNDEGRASKVF
jgi:hypothetical protein